MFAQTNGRRDLLETEISKKKQLWNTLTPLGIFSPSLDSIKVHKQRMWIERNRIGIEVNKKEKRERRKKQTLWQTLPQWTVAISYRIIDFLPPTFIHCCIFLLQWRMLQLYSTLVVFWSFPTPRVVLQTEMFQQTFDVSTSVYYELSEF